MTPVTENKKEFLDLLLLADPCEEMVDRYLEHGEMFVWHEGGRVVAEAVIASDGEIKNLAIVSELQGQGRGRRVLDDLARHYRGRFEALTVGTSISGVPFYEKCGFRYSRTLPGFFTENYPEPIFESGVQCVDMICLARPL